MNKTRRKELEKAIDLLGQAQEIVDCCAEEERDAYDNLSEGVQESERGMQMEENADNLEDASSNLQDVINQIQEVVDA